MSDVPKVEYNTQTYGLDPENTGLALSWPKGSLMSSLTREEL
jgi:hypothetical protein